MRIWLARLERMERMVSRSWALSIMKGTVLMRFLLLAESPLAALSEGGMKQSPSIIIVPSSPWMRSGKRT